MDPAAAIAADSTKSAIAVPMVVEQALLEHVTGSQQTVSAVVVDAASSQQQQQHDNGKARMTAAAPSAGDDVILPEPGSPAGLLRQRAGNGVAGDCGGGSMEPKIVVPGRGSIANGESSVSTSGLADWSSDAVDGGEGTPLDARQALLLDACPAGSESSDESSNDCAASKLQQNAEPAKQRNPGRWAGVAGASSLGIEGQMEGSTERRDTSRDSSGHILQREDSGEGEHAKSGGDGAMDAARCSADAANAPSADAVLPELRASANERLDSSSSAHAKAANAGEPLDVRIPCGSSIGPQRRLDRQHKQADPSRLNRQRQGGDSSALGSLDRQPQEAHPITVRSIVSEWLSSGHEVITVRR